MAAIPARGRWIGQMFTTTSTATFIQGNLVKLSTARTLSEYSGGEAGWLGIANHSSANSIPPGQVLVMVPHPGATARVNVPTGLAASSLSIGETVGFYKVGNINSYITTSYTSLTGRIAQIVGACDSANSTIEVAFLADDLQLLDSTTSVAIA